MLSICHDFSEESDLDGAIHKVQYFQRAVLDFRMDAAYRYSREAPETTVAESLGTLRLLQSGTAPLPGGIATPPPVGQGERVCEATAHGPTTTEPIDDAPMRSSVGKGFVLRGEVRSTRNCAPVPGASIIFWLAGPDGRYDDAHRAKVITDAKGKYTFASNYPGFYGAGSRTSTSTCRQAATRVSRRSFSWTATRPMAPSTPCWPLSRGRLSREAETGGQGEVSASP